MDGAIAASEVMLDTPIIETTRFVARLLVTCCWKKVIAA